MHERMKGMERYEVFAGCYRSNGFGFAFIMGENQIWDVKFFGQKGFLGCAFKWGFCGGNSIDDLLEQNGRHGWI
jgi:hypothetical protein